MVTKKRVKQSASVATASTSEKKKPLWLIEEEAKDAAVRHYIGHFLELLGEANDAGLISSTMDLGAICRTLQDFAVALDGGDADHFVDGDGNDQLLSMLGYE